MKLWLYHHRRTIYCAYMAVATTVILVLQILQIEGKL